MRIKTLPQIVKNIKDHDPNTAVNESMLKALIASGSVPHEKRGNRTVADLDVVIASLNHMLGLENAQQTPHIRTIRSAICEVKQKFPDLGIGEKQIRTAIENEQLDVIRIGNRAYIAMEFFEEPYVSRFSPSCNTAFTTGKNSNHAIEQISTLLSRNTGVPIVKRVKRSA